MDPVSAVIATLALVAFGGFVYWVALRKWDIRQGSKDKKSKGTGTGSPKPTKNKQRP